MNKKMKVKNHDALAQLLLKNSALDLYQHILQDHTIEDVLAQCRQQEDYRLAFRAAWTLEHILLHNPTLLSIHHSEVIDLYCSTDNESSLRSLSKLVIYLLKTPTVQLSEEMTERILSVTFPRVEKDGCPVALLVNCWDILYLLAKEYKELGQELQALILFHLEKNSTPANKSRGHKILTRLKRDGIA